MRYPETIAGGAAPAVLARRPLGLAEARKTLDRIGRNKRPALLARLDLAPEALRGLVLDVWTEAEWPAACLPCSLWIAWFRMAAYPPPDEPLVAAPRRRMRVGCRGRRAARWPPGSPSAGAARVPTSTPSPPRLTRSWPTWTRSWVTADEASTR